MRIIHGNIFSTKCQTIVNTINCVGVMGAGIAFEFRLRYPEMYNNYVQLCNNNQIQIGTLWIYKSDNRWVLNFPTKTDWKRESKIEYIEKGLQKFINTYKEKGISSIAFPILGASNGGIPEDVSIGIMEKYLIHCDIPVEVYSYDPFAYDDLFVKFRTALNNLDGRTVSEKSGLRIHFINRLKAALEQDDIKSMSGLLSISGIGQKTLEKCFQYLIKESDNESNLDLFN